MLDDPGTWLGTLLDVVRDEGSVCGVLVALGWACGSLVHGPGRSGRPRWRIWISARRNGDDP